VRADEALEAALQALGHRDRSAAELDRRLRERGFSPEERSEALARLRRTGLVDDARFAEARARILAERGAGDALIRDRLGQAGVSRELVEDALAATPPEAERARRIVAARGPGPRTARYLLGKGFAEDVVRELVADPPGGELG